MHSKNKFLTSRPCEFNFNMAMFNNRRRDMFTLRKFKYKSTIPAPVFRLSYKAYYGEILLVEKNTTTIDLVKAKCKLW